MLDHSATLRVGDQAPGFQLMPANRTEEVTLEKLISWGPAIVEFLRGTW